MPMGHEMSREDRVRMTVGHHQATAWLPVLVMILGLWLAATPVTVPYRSSVHAWLDAGVGLSAIALGATWLLAPLRFLAQWTIPALGFWLLTAPLVFWSGAPEFVSDTFIGAMLIACSILIPEMPGMMMVMRPGPQVPPGSSYTPLRGCSAPQ